jgi:hypothetical protein
VLLLALLFQVHQPVSVTQVDEELKRMQGHGMVS